LLVIVVESQVAIDDRGESRLKQHQRAVNGLRLARQDSDVLTRINVLASVKHGGQSYKIFVCFARAET
jgi:hypothetical protein